MTADGPGVSAAVEVTVAGRAVAVEFRAEPDQLLAGGPLSFEVVVSLRDGEPGHLIAGAARATGRSREYSFDATPAGGDPLADPYAGAVEIGGVQTASTLSLGEPVVEHLLLNQFLTLEDLRDDVADGSSIELAVTGTRLIQFQESSAEPVGASVTLRLTLHRDDAALSARYEGAAEQVMAAPQVDGRREALVTLLCTARNSLAVAALTTLTGHPDASVAARARHALSAP